MGEASASYTQDVDTGTAKEQTLGEAQIKLQQSNAMMTGILTVATRNEVFSYREISRRFCLKKSLDPDARKFQQKCKAYGIPPQFLDVELWDIACDMPLGSGNQTLEMAQATQLMQARSAHSPDAQAEILHIYDAAITQNPQLAQRLAPTGKKPAVSSGQTWASSIFGSLMQGTMVPMQPELSPIDQIKTLLGMTAGVVTKIMQSDNVGTPDDIAGLGMVLKYIQQLLQILAQDPAQKQQVKQFSDALGKLTNIIKGFAQRQQQANKAKAPKMMESIAFKDLEAYPAAQGALLQSVGLPPQKDAAASPQVEKARQSMAIKEAQFQQKTKHADISFQLEQLRKATEQDLNLSHDEQIHRQEIAHAAAAKLMELLAQASQPEVKEPEPAASP